jgi:hypothetical protein
MTLKAKLQDGVLRLETLRLRGVSGAKIDSRIMGGATQQPAYFDLRWQTE